MPKWSVVRLERLLRCVTGEGDLSPCSRRPVWPKSSRMTGSADWASRPLEAGLGNTEHAAEPGRVGVPPARRRGVVTIVLVALLGATVFASGAWYWNTRNVAQTRADFGQMSDNLSSDTANVLLRYGDLVAASAALFDQGVVTRAEYRSYLQAVGFGSSRFKGVEGIGLVQRVKLEQIPGFLASLRADGIAITSLLPGGRRPSYCLGSYADWRNLKVTVPLFGFDFCTQAGDRDRPVPRHRDRATTSSRRVRHRSRLHVGLPPGPGRVRPPACTSGRANQAGDGVGDRHRQRNSAAPDARRHAGHPVPRPERVPGSGQLRARADLTDRSFRNGPMVLQNKVDAAVVISNDSDLRYPSSRRASGCPSVSSTRRQTCLQATSAESVSVMASRSRQVTAHARFVGLPHLPTGARIGRLASMHKTALRLDEELLAQARDLLGTKTTTDTIHAALTEVVARRGRERLFERLRTQDGIDLADEEVMAGAWR